ncbi:MAG: hypothetical protein HUU35_01240, partial [Armatimonadetes bacterium]|nr:hypothetical protein [Armatimonadota bacterium]
GLLGAADDLRPEYVALAVSARLIGGLTCRGLRSPAPEVYVASFGDEQHGTQLVWSEGERHALEVAQGCEVYDILGRRLAAEGSLSVAHSPVYLVQR